MRVAVAAILACLMLAAPAVGAEPYEVVPGFDDVPAKGPAAALGLVIWNHGVSGNREQGAFPPPTFVRRLAQAGWDVVRIKRDALRESNWATAGLLHVARTVEEVERQRTAGYKRIVLAGQSYGGAITLEAARRTPVYAIVPSAPGTGVSLTDLGSPITSAHGSHQLYEALAEGRFERAVPILPFADEYSSGNPERGRKSRAILAGRGVPFLVLDGASTWLAGHSASSSAMMGFVYANCVVDFLDPARSPAAGSSSCGKDGLAPAVDMLAETAQLRPMVMEGGTWWKAFEGIWLGAWSDPVLVSLAIERGADGKPELVYLWGERNGAKLRTTYRAPALLEGSVVRAKLPHQDVALNFEMTTRQVVLRWQNPEGRSSWVRLRKYEPRD